MTEETGSGWENKALRMQRAVLGTGKMEGAEAPSGVGEAAKGQPGWRWPGSSRRSRGHAAFFRDQGRLAREKSQLQSKQQSQPVLNRAGVGAGRVLCAPEVPQHVLGAPLPGC